MCLICCESGGGYFPEDATGAAQYGLQGCRVWDGDQWTQVCFINHLLWNLHFLHALISVLPELCIVMNLSILHLMINDNGSFSQTVTSQFFLVSNRILNIQLDKIITCYLLEVLIAAVYSKCLLNVNYLKKKNVFNQWFTHYWMKQCFLNKSLK